MRDFFYKYYWIFIFIFFLLVVILSCFFLKSPNYEKPLFIKISHNNITFNNSLPISDSLGKEMTYSKANRNIQGFSEITITNSNEDKMSYTLVITKKNNSEYQINDNYVKMYLTDENNNPIKGFETEMIPSFPDLKIFRNDSMRRVLYKDVIKKGEEKKFILRSWISDSYAISSQIEECSFVVEVII
jgi:hypothetical protein